MKKIVLFMITVILLFSCSKTEDVIKIGAAMPLSGDGAVYGVPQRNAAQLALDEINEQGGLLGKKVVIDFQDDQANPTQAVNTAKYFTADKDIVGVIGYPNSGNAMASAKIFNEVNLPYIATSPTNPKLTQLGYKNIFRFAPTDDMQGISDAEFIFNELKLKELVILNDNQAYGNGIATQVKEHFEKIGGKITLFDNIPVGQKNYRNILTKIRNTNVKVIFYGGMLEEGAILVKQAEEMGIKCIFVFGDGCFDEKFIKLAGTECNNVYISYLELPWNEVPTAKSFAERYKAKYKQDVPPFTPYGYDAVMVLARAIKECKSTQKDDILKALQSKEFKLNGVTGNISFNEKGQTIDRKFYIYTFVDGKLKLR